MTSPQPIRRIVAFLMMVTVSAGVCGCGSDSAAEPPPPPKKAAAPKGRFKAEQGVKAKQGVRAEQGKPANPPKKKDKAKP